MNSINKNIEYYRKQNNLTQKELADKLFVSAGTISKWENGLTEPSVDVIKQIADIFNISVSMLYGESENCDTFNTIIEHTNQNPKRNMIIVIIYAVMAIVFLSLGIFTTCIKLIPVNYILFAFFGLSLLLESVSIYMFIQNKKQKGLPATLTKKGIILSDGTTIEYCDIACAKAFVAYEKFFFRMIGSKVSAHTFGRLTIIKKDNKHINLFYVENVENVKNTINSRL